jgi:hypothetical protein
VGTGSSLCQNQTESSSAYQVLFTHTSHLYQVKFAAVGLSSTLGAIKRSILLLPIVNGYSSLSHKLWKLVKHGCYFLALFRSRVLKHGCSGVMKVCSVVTFFFLALFVDLLQCGRLDLFSVV